MKWILPLLLLALWACTETADDTGVELQILGIVQDGGSPHIGCEKTCCATLFANDDHSRKVTSLAAYDHNAHHFTLFEASPDIAQQLKDASETTNKQLPDALFLTHAHIGHYSGLMYLGKEAKDAKRVKVYAMPRMNRFLRTNGPWNLLVSRQNISLNKIEAGTEIPLTKQLTVQAVLVPHRDEYSETVGYYIKGPRKTALFIPDIDKWEKWDLDINEEIKKVDYALLDATFYDNGELQNRDMSEVPHPFMIESMKRFETLGKTDRSKVYFIHLNHSNPALEQTSEAYRTIYDKGFHICAKGMKLKL